MQINSYIRDIFTEEAERSIIDEIHLGLGYSAVTLTDGRCGLCSTWIDRKETCTVFKGVMDFEKGRASVLLDLIDEDDMIARTVVIALVNALNAGRAAGSASDTGSLFDDLRLQEGKHLAMIGYFAPVVKKLSDRGVTVHAYDIGKAVGDADEFYRWASAHADAVILSATSVINNSTEEVFERLGFREVPTVIMGPSTIMCPEIYRDLPIGICAGVSVVDREGVLKAIRNGKGTPMLLKHSRKVYMSGFHT